MLTVYRRIFWNKLKNLYVYKLLINNWFIVAFFLVITLFAVKNILFSFALIIFSIYVNKKSRGIVFICIVVSLLFLLRYVWLEVEYKPDSAASVEGYVTDIKEYPNYSRLAISSGGKRYYVYDYSNQNVLIGDYCKAEGANQPAEGVRIEGGFSYKHYLRQNGISGVIKCNKITITKHHFHIGIIRQRVLKYMEKSFSTVSLGFLKAIILGDSGGFEEDFQAAIRINGIAHLFAISGLHVGLLIGLIYKLLEYAGLKRKASDYIVIIFLAIYMILVNFTPSILRAVLLFYFSFINKTCKAGLASLDILSIIFILLILWNPYYIYQVGFILSFLVTFTIMLTSPLITKHKHFFQILIISLFSSVVTFPVIINLNNEINILSPLTNVIYIDAVGYFILPLSLIVMFLPVLDWAYKYIILLFNKITVFASEFFVCKISFASLSIMGICVYYLLLIAIIKTIRIKKIKYIAGTVYILFLAALSNICIFNPNTEVLFLDLNYGESIIITDNHNKCNIVLDTGSGQNNEVGNYLKRKGIKRIDYLIITHNHDDHNGEAAAIIKNFTVCNLVLGAYDTSVLSHKANIKVKKGDRLNTGTFHFYVLHPDGHYEDENDNSIVLYGLIGDLYFLFLGDITSRIEEKIMAMDLHVDVLKVAHHGSATSTSSDFISKIKPKFAIIQVGRIEKFGFPSAETIMTLNRYNVFTYRTDYHYSVKYRYNKKKGIFTTIR